MSKEPKEPNGAELDLKLDLDLDFDVKDVREKEPAKEIRSRHQEDDRKYDESEKGRKKEKPDEKRGSDRERFNDEEMRAVVGRLLNDDVKISAERSERSERSERADRTERSERSEKYEHSEKGVDVVRRKGKEDPPEVDYLDYIQHVSSLTTRGERGKDIDRSRLGKERIERRRSEITQTGKINRSEYEALHETESVPRQSHSGEMSIALEMKYVVAVIAFIFLIILSFSVYRMRALSSQLKQAEAKLETIEDSLNSRIQDLTIENDGLVFEKEQLLIENENLRAQLGGDFADSVMTESMNSSSDSTDNESEGQTSESGEKRHTVRRGESLWVIAKSYYGTGARYTDIMTANNLRNENDIKEGQELIIP